MDGFLSTPSARRATGPRERGAVAGAISIHALREEGDHMIFLPSLLTSQFLSTPSARRATPGLRDCPVQVGDFYPRPPRGGRRLLLHGGCPLCNFYPRPPRGGRQHNGLASGTVQQFLSTPSARRATFFSFSVSPSNRLFLSTPSARRATGNVPYRRLRSIYFYPRPPRGGRLLHECRVK